MFRYVIPIIVGGTLVYGVFSTVNLNNLDVVQRGEIPFEDEEEVSAAELRDRVDPLERQIIEEQLEIDEEATSTEDQEFESAPDFNFSDEYRDFSLSSPNDPFITRVVVDPYKPNQGDTMTVVVEVRSAYEVNEVNITTSPHETEEDQSVISNNYSLERVGFINDGDVEVWSLDLEAEGNYENGYLLDVEAETDRNSSSAELVMP